MTPDYAILVVDDEVPFTEIMAEILRSYGLQTKVAHSAKEALGLMSDGVPQLLILDVMMPEIDGLTLMGQVKSNTRWDGIPVVIASASVMPDQQAAAFTAGADVFLKKPFNSKELRAALRPYVAIPDTADLLSKRGG
jgi:CheY-like chemotaxis protein